jgi:hypothetical protein
MKKTSKRQAARGGRYTGAFVRITKERHTAVKDRCRRLGIPINSLLWSLYVKSMEMTDAEIIQMCADGKIRELEDAAKEEPT